MDWSAYSWLCEKDVPFPRGVDSLISSVVLLYPGNMSPSLATRGAMAAKLHKKEMPHGRANRACILIARFWQWSYEVGCFPFCESDMMGMIYIVRQRSEESWKYGVNGGEGILVCFYSQTERRWMGQARWIFFFRSTSSVLWGKKCCEGRAVYGFWYAMWSRQEVESCMGVQRRSGDLIAESEGGRRVYVCMGEGRRIKKRPRGRGMLEKRLLMLLYMGDGRIEADVGKNESPRKGIP